MKSVIISSIAMLFLLAFVISSALITHRILVDVGNDVESAESYIDYERISEAFERSERFLSLTLSDNTLCEIEYSILEIRDYLKHGSEDEANAAKSRLLSKIREARRLSGLNPRSIF